MVVDDEEEAISTISACDTQWEEDDLQFAVG